MRIIKILSAAVVFSAFTVNAQTDSSLTYASDTSIKANTIPLFTTTLESLEEESEQQDVSGLLQSSNDVFSNIAGFNFSAARFRVRGYDSENFTVMMNGVTLNSPDNGRAIWAYWGGLNDITRYQNSKAGIHANPLSFGGIGGTSNIDARASAQRKGSRVSYGFSNRSYNHRVMATHSTGMMSNGLAVTVSGSVRYSNEGYVEGTYYRAGAYFLSLEKKLNDKHSIGFVGFGSPTVQGRSSISTQETYDLTDNNFYNSYWGMQDGKKRNSRERRTHKPMMMLNHYFKANEKLNVQSSISYSFGKGGNTSLNWHSGTDPRPDYYKYLPSYYNQPGQEFLFDQTTTNWQNNIGTQQLNWDQLYFANSKNLYTVVDADGTPGKTVTGNRAKYIVEERRTDHSQYGFNTALSYQLKENIMLSGGLSANFFKSMNFKVLDDLLGADFWVDVDQFAERDFADNIVAQSNVDIPNNTIKEGDRFGYDYDIHVNTINTFGQIEGTSKKIDYYAGLSLTSTSFYRVGNVENGLFREKSVGKSETSSFFNFGLKGGAVYKITGRHLVRLNGAFLNRAPLTRNAFVSPRTRGELIPDLKSEKVQSADLSYIVRYPKVKVRFTGYYTKISDKTRSRSLYFEEKKTFVNYIMSGIDQSFTGLELGAQANIIPTVEATGALALGTYIYDSNPVVTITQDNSSELLADNREVYLKNFKLGGIPQTAASFGLKYNSPKYWYTGFNANFFANAYIDANPDRRTEEALDIYVQDDPQVAEIVEQTEVKSNFSINFFVGKSWKIKDKYFLRLNINVNNVLDNTDFQTGGFEQFRFDRTDVNRWPPKVGYMYGRTYFAMVTFQF
ncbi:MAG: hypothetical protein ACPGSO_02670 [Vicingaceae bacterium]